MLNKQSSKQNFTNNNSSDYVHVSAMSGIAGGIGAGMGINFTQAP